MYLQEALKINNAVRRKGKAIHAGSNGDSYVNIDFLLGAGNQSEFQTHTGFGLTKEDLMANDWEPKPPKYFCKCGRSWEGQIEDKFTVTSNPALQDVKENIGHFWTCLKCRARIFVPNEGLTIINRA